MELLSFKLKLTHIYVKYFEGIDVEDREENIPLHDLEKYARAENLLFREKMSDVTSEMEEYPISFDAWQNEVDDKVVERFLIWRLERLVET